VITDFTQGVDKLMLNDFLGPLPEETEPFSVWAADHIAASGTTDTLITLDSPDDTILLTNVLPEQLRATDFIPTH